MIYRNFEDIPVWQESRVLVKKIYDLIKINQKVGRDFSLSDQIKRAANSILCNIAEGFERGTNKEFAQFLTIAKGSAAEVRSALYVMLDADYIDQIVFHDLYTSLKNISIHIAGFKSYLLGNKSRSK